MRTYRVRVNGRPYIVTVDEAGGDRLKATLSNEAYETEPVRDDQVSSWVVSTSKDAVRAHATNPHGHQVDVWLAGLPFHASVEAVPAAGHVSAIGASAEKRVGGEIRALMPGRITSILVKEGDLVEVGSSLLTLEAMKMQNEIVSPISGWVQRIQVQEGAAVKKDALLIVVQ